MTFFQRMTCLLFAAVTFSAVAIEYPDPIKGVEQRGVTIVGEFAAPDGLQGYVGTYQGEGVSMYLTSDKQYVLLGMLLDSQGNDLSAAELEKQVYEPMSKEMWAKMAVSTWIADGDTKAQNIVYVFTDPNCIYCREFWQQARPWVKEGKVQLRHIVVGMLQVDSPQKAAALLLADDPSLELEKFEASGGKEALILPATLDEDIQKKLEGNLALMGQVGADATPGIYYLSPEGRLQQSIGLPDVEEMPTIMGSGL